MSANDDQDFARDAGRVELIGRGPGSDDQWTRYARLCAIAVAALIIATVATNVVVNPRSEFPLQVVQPYEHNEPAIKLYYFEQPEEPYHTLLLGSSRVMKYEPAAITAHTGQSAFNFGMSGGFLRDALAITRHAIETDRVPQEILLGLDLDRFAPLRDSPFRMEDALGPLHHDPGAEDWLDALTGTLSARYLGASVYSVWLQAGGADFTGNLDYDEDGLIHYKPVERLQQQGRYDGSQRVAQSIAGRGPILAPEQPDPNRIAMLHEMIGMATENDIRLTVFFTTYHEDLWRLAQAGNEADRKQWVVAEMLPYCGPAFRIVDQQNGTRYNFHPDEWLDAWHPFEANTRILVDDLYLDERDLCKGAEIER